MTELRPFAQTDIERLRQWLAAPHVRPWYNHPEEWLREVKNEDGAFDWIHHFIILWNGKPVGFCQYYAYWLGGETWHGDLDAAGAYSIDYLIGDAGCLRRGVGRAAVLAMLALLRRTDAAMVIAQPETGNNASCGLLLACGFSYDRARGLYRYDFDRDTRNTRDKKRR